MVDRRVSALEATLGTSNERISALESELASNDAQIVAKLEQLDRLEMRHRIADEGPSLMSTTIHEYGPQLRVAEAAQFSAGVALHLAESQLQVVCLSEASPSEDMGQL